MNASRKLLDDAVREIVRDELERLGHGEWIDQNTSPLGKRKHCELARTGKLPAKKVSGRWLVRRDDMNAYIQTHGISRGRSGEEKADDILSRWRTEE